MRYFEAENSNDMAYKVYPALEKFGIIGESRNGQVLRFEEPVVLCFTQPWHRANFTVGRNANPFFHLAESMWMLAGRNDLEYLTLFNGQMANYSDDGHTLNAAYGYRARRHWGHDQLKEVVSLLRSDPDSRQAVVQLWDNEDSTKMTKDKACNMLMVFSIVGEELQLVVHNRSNDLVYGNVTGANPVHFSYFQQYVANQLDVRMGKMYFMSSNMHVYLDLYDHWKQMEWGHFQSVDTQYPDPLFNLQEVEELCHQVVDDNYISSQFESEHLNSVIVPVLNAFLMRKFEKEGYLAALQVCTDPAIYTACHAWMTMRDVERQL